MGTVVTLKIPNAETPDTAAVSSKKASPQRMVFTETRIENIRTPELKVTYTYDDAAPGLALRVTPSGVRTFVVVKKIAGKTERITLGRWPGVRLADARRATNRINGDVAAGDNPVAQRKAARLRAETCNDYWPTYLDHLKRKNRTWRRDQQRWTVEISPVIGRKPLASITTSDCQSIIDRIGARRPIAANRVGALLGAFFGHAAKHEKVARNPARGLSRYPEHCRDRFLSGPEIHQFLEACANSPEPWGDFFAVLLLTGARKGNVMAMRWSDVDLHNGVWKIPAASAKNKLPAAIPLIAPALSILQRRSEVHSHSNWVFPSSSKTGHVVHAAKGWAALIKSAGLTNLRPHDLRRTVGSWLAASGANAFVIQKVLTHKSAASAKAYTHLDVEAAREALSEFGAFTEARQSPNNSD